MSILFKIFHESNIDNMLFYMYIVYAYINQNFIEHTCMLNFSRYKVLPYIHLALTNKKVSVHDL